MIDSTPKIARIYTAHGVCGTWSGSCPEVKDNAPPGAYDKPESEYTRACKQAMRESHGQEWIHSPWYGWC
jgi:hypothetical protein